MICGPAFELLHTAESSEQNTTLTNEFKSSWSCCILLFAFPFGSLLHSSYSWKVCFYLIHQPAFISKPDRHYSLYSYMYFYCAHNVQHINVHLQFLSNFYLITYSVLVHFLVLFKALVLLQYFSHTFSCFPSVFGMRSRITISNSNSSHNHSSLHQIIGSYSNYFLIIKFQ